MAHGPFARYFGPVKANIADPAVLLEVAAGAGLPRAETAAFLAGDALTAEVVAAARAAKGARWVARAARAVWVVAALGAEARAATAVAAVVGSRLACRTRRRPG